MNQCEFVNAKGVRCTRPACKNSKYCAHHNYYLKKKEKEKLIYNITNNESVDNKDDMEESSVSNNIDRYRVYQYIKDYNELTNVGNVSQPTPVKGCEGHTSCSPKSSNSSMEAMSVMLIPLAMKLLPLLLKYLRPNISTTNEPIDKPQPKRDDPISTTAEKVCELPKRDPEDVIIPIVQ